jgi:hypothetical protein
MSSDPEEQRGRLRRARVVSWITLGAFAVVAVVSAVLVARGGSTPLLLVADALCVFIVVRTVLRLRAVNAALRELDE